MGILKKLNLERETRERIQRMKNAYGENFFKVLGLPNKRIKALEGRQELFEERLANAERYLENGSPAGAATELDVLEQMVRLTQKSIKGKEGEKLSLDDFGRTEPLTRELLQEEIGNNKRSFKALPEDMMNDVSYARAILKNPLEVIRLLAPLDKELGESEEGKHRLTSLLTKKETEHGFPEVKALPVGILSSDFFEGMTAWGWQSKDLGAGLKHGENTHRLQWHALMQKFEEDNKDERTRWSHTPFELFTKISELDKKNETKNWALLMDTSGNDIQGELGLEMIKENPTGFLGGAGFTKPDESVLIFRALAEVSDSPLAKSVNDRYEKRKTEMLEEGRKEQAEEIFRDVTRQFATLKQEQNREEFRVGLKKFRDTNRAFLGTSTLEQIAKYLKMEAGEFEKIDMYEIDYSPNSPELIAYSLYMDAYAERKKKKMKGYEQPIMNEELLVGKESTDKDMVAMEPEVKRLMVLERCDQSRKKFGLPVQFGTSEKAELIQRMKEVKNATAFHLENVSLDVFDELLKVDDLGINEGLGAVIRHLESKTPIKEITEKLMRWRKVSREVIRTIQILQNKLRELEYLLQAVKLEMVVKGLQQAPNQEMIDFLEQDPDGAVKLAENNPLVKFEFRAKLLGILKPDEMKK